MTTLAPSSHHSIDNSASTREGTKMDLLLWRHAEAEDGPIDLKRRLTPRGEKQADAMAKWIRAHAPKGLRILASPAVRTQQTAAALGLPFETLNALKPNANVADVLAACGWPDGSTYGNAVLVVGHQPTLGQVAALLLGGHEAEWSIKKGAVWWLTKRVRHREAQSLLKAVMGPEFTHY
ncbi:putative phosphohistidine phosphatase [Oryzomicrobium terrae]|uniref:Putative phosphohistidine phosphatase n=2 Tax=Oryzomicrobium terrae TaxID=1735038 RepID=A0A5C1EC62_9RHOO|nr:putative phosphohistidine phosphatase [Oryzomicrobium terrae]